jgi:CDP-diacylglycerol--glycerol-3-phosphate 3-phosphatidyltransferase
MLKNKDLLSNIPNVLSLVRIAVAPILIVLLMAPGKFLSVLSAFLFLIASLTDLIDGYIARKYNATSSLGKFLDPLADKLLVSTSLIMLVALGRAPAWMAALIIGREVAVTGLRSMAISDGIVIESSRMGKYKTFSQITAIIGLLLHYTFLGINWHSVGAALLWVALIMTLWSGLEYLQGFIRKES